MNKNQSSPHYSQLRRSLEYYHCRKTFFLTLAISVAFTVLFVIALILGAQEQKEEVAVLMLLVTLVLDGFCIYTGHRWWQIFRHMDDYTFFSVTLTKPTVIRSRYRASVCYSLTFPNAEGKIITRETAAMFSNANLPYFNGKTVLVGYNEVTDRLVVIDRIYT